jgi:hypothetical protein
MLCNMRGAKELEDYDRGLLINIRMLRNVAISIRHLVLAYLIGSAVGSCYLVLFRWCTCY